MFMGDEKEKKEKGKAEEAAEKTGEIVGKGDVGAQTTAIMERIKVALSSVPLWPSYNTMQFISPYAPLCSHEF